MAARFGELTRTRERETTGLAFASKDNFAAVAAIDFGTSYSGYAFSYKTNSTEIRCPTDWGSEVGATMYKTPTCVLTDKHNRFVAFGYEALNKYAEDPDADTAFDFYDRFKMTLFKDKVIGTKTTITSRGGRVIQAEIIIALGLKYLYEHVLKALQISNERKINKKQIRWVLTVPAIWSESAKQMMRRAAFKAGIIDSLGSKRLIIALEPEAASFWCRQLTLDKFAGDAEQTGALLMTEGTKYMVVDCGGGTVDITLHQLKDNLTVTEVYRANGGPWGGTTVDDKFIELLHSVCGRQFIVNYKRDNPQDWLNTMVQFETKKRSYDPDIAKSVNISFSFKFGMALFKEKNLEIDEVIRNAQVNGVSCRQGLIILESSVMEKLFVPSISQIISHIKDLLKKPQFNDLAYIFLVGGYSDCRFLQKKSISNFSGKIKVLIPENAGMCIMRGAVLFGHKPNAVLSRIARKTYGEGVMERFVSDKHDPEKKTIVDEEEMCDNVFSVWIKKNESIMSGESRTFRSFPHSKTSTTSCTSIYSSDNVASEIMYVTDPGVKQIGTLRINIPDTHLDKYDRTITKHVFFGGTEIHVRVEDSVRGTEGDSAETNIDFLTE